MNIYIPYTYIYIYTHTSTGQLQPSYTAKVQSSYLLPRVENTGGTKKTTPQQAMSCPPRLTLTIRERGVMSFLPRF